MVVEIRRAVVAQEAADAFGMVTGDVALAEMLAHLRGFLGLDHSVVVGTPRTRLGGELDAQLLQHGDNLVIDVFGAVVGVESVHDKR